MTTEPTYSRTYEPLKFLGRHPGRLFFVPMRVNPRTSHLSYAPTWEDTGERWAPTVVARIPLTKFALGLGIWLDVDPDSVVMAHSDDAEFDAYVAVNGQVDRGQWQTARDKITEMGLDPDEEMGLIQSMGVVG